LLLGTLVLGKRFRGQQLAVLIAASGVAQLANLTGGVPWIALTVALSFGTYGLVRKVLPVDAVAGPAVETLALTPLAAACLVCLSCNGQAHFLSGNVRLELLVFLSDIVTSVPLLCFAQTVRLLGLCTIGILQFLAPSLQFLLAVLFHREPFHVSQGICFGFIWTALTLYTIDAVLLHRRLNPAAERS
jgi:chloramphenicol-sensitive protein RarD